MACQIFLISQQDFKGVADISSNLDDKYFTPSLKAVHDCYLRPMLGVDLYNELIAQVEGGTISEDNEALIEQLKPYLVWKVYWDYLQIANVQATEVGVRKRRDEWTDAVDNLEHNMLVRRADQYAIAYERQVVNFLNENKDCYPLWQYDSNKAWDSIASAGIKIRGIGAPARAKIRVIDLYKS